MNREPAPEPIRFPRPVPARAGLRPRVTLPDYVPARMLNEFVYCPRLFFYEWVEGVFAESGDTVEGSLRHETIRGREGALRPAQDAEGEKTHARSVTLSSERLKIIAVIDLVEGTGTTVTPIDYKRGAPRLGEEGPEAWAADRAQVCAQALILRDNGYTCDEAVLYYDATRQRVRVAIDEQLVAETIGHLEHARRLGERGLIPAPLVDSPKCPRCSLVSICLPDETAVSMGLPSDEDCQRSLFEEDAPAEPRPLVRPRDQEIRRLVPARDDLRPLYITGQGLSVGKSGEVLRIRDRSRPH
jgi:CRISP-associated protein Cas1